MPKVDTHDIDVVAGAMYFVVGRGTEGGKASYHLSVVGITPDTAGPDWGKAEAVMADSGYSIGAIQVDLGKRGTWALGSTRESPLKPGEHTYVDAIIKESSAFAENHGLPYTTDKAQLRAQLLSHGNGLDGRSTLVFVDPETYDSINAWASSAVGQPWVHRNIDYPQIRHATQSAMDLLDTHGKNVPEDRRLEAIALLAKTDNQIPAKMREFEKVLKDGGNYEDLLDEARKIAGRHGYYAGLKAVHMAEQYEVAYLDTERAAALDRAHAKVGRADFDPSFAAADPDFQEALRAIGQVPPVRILRQGSHGDDVAALQAGLAKLGITDAHGRALHVDGDFGPGTHAAVVKFQHAHGLEADGLAGPKTLQTLHEATRLQSATLAYYDHPGHALFCQALRGVQLLDAKCGRTPDYLSENLAGSLATAARGQGLGRIDHVVLGENATRVLAVQGELESPLRQVAGVDVLPAIAKPLLRSSAEFQALPPPAMSQRPGEAPGYQALAGPPLSAIQR